MDNKDVISCLVEYTVHCIRNDTKVKLSECVRCKRHLGLEFENVHNVLAVKCGEEE